MVIDINDKMYAKIKTVLKKHSNIEFVYIFGSSTKRSFEMAKDFDIAVFLKNNIRGLAKLNLINLISLEIENIVKKTVDVVILNDASPALKQQVIKYGNLVYERKKGLSRDFIVHTITVYLDYLDLLNFFHKRLVEKGK